MTHSKAKKTAPRPVRKKDGFYITNGELWTATQPESETELSAFQSAQKIPMTVLESRNAAALARKVQEALGDLVAARSVLLEQNGERMKDTPNQWKILDADGMTAGWNLLAAEKIFLANVRPMNSRAFAPSAFIAPDVLGKLGPLLVEV